MATSSKGYSLTLRGAMFWVAGVALAVTLLAFVSKRPYLYEWERGIGIHYPNEAAVARESRDGDWLVLCSTIKKSDDFTVTSYFNFRYKVVESWKYHGLWFYYMERIRD